MNRTYQPLYIVHGAVAALVLAVAPAVGWAQEKIPYDEAHIFFELNDTDGDLGIHALFDGDAWKWLRIHDPEEIVILHLRLQRRLRGQGLTELFFESAEPPFESEDPEELTQTPEEFFRRFPAGTYRVQGRTLEDEPLLSFAEVTQVMPAPAGNILIAGIAAVEDCDVVPLPVVMPDANGTVTIAWDPVTTSHPDLGESDPAIEIVAYQFFAEFDDADENTQVYSVDLPPSVTAMEIPAGFIALNDEFKFEIQVREASGNQTAVESCFVLAEGA